MMFGLFQKSIMKIKLKDILTLTLTNAKKEVKSLTDPQIVKLLDKLDKLFVIVEAYSDSKFAKSMEDKLDEELDEESSRDTLLHLLQGKARTLAGREPRLARAALLRFAASRGFETDQCYRCVDEVCRTMNIPDDEQTD